MTNSENNIEYTESFEKQNSILSPIPILNKNKQSENIIIIENSEEENQTDLLLEQNNKYYNEYIKLFEANSILKSQLNTLLKEKNVLKHSLQKLETNFSKNGVDNLEIDDMYTNRRVKIENFIINS